jgi:hypothetical protein
MTTTSKSENGTKKQTDRMVEADEYSQKKPENCFQKMDAKKIDSSDGEQKRITRKKDPIDY